jgi:hypothetical protein
VEVPDVKRVGRFTFAGKTRVRGPGQNSFMRGSYKVGISCTREDKDFLSSTSVKIGLNKSLWEKQQLPRRSKQQQQR